MAPHADASQALLAAKWSFSVSSCDLRGDRALAHAEAIAEALIGRGHMAVVIAARQSDARLAQVTTRLWRDIRRRALEAAARWSG